MVQPVTATTHILWSRLNSRKVPSSPVAPVDIAKVYAGRAESIRGDGRELVGEICSRRVNAEGVDRERAPDHERVDFGHDEHGDATDLQLAGEAHDRPQFAPRDKADPSPVEVAQGHGDDERRCQHLLTDEYEGHSPETAPRFDHDHEADDVGHVSGQACGSAPRLALAGVEDQLEQRVDE